MLIDGGRITGVGKNVAIPAGAEIVDLSSKTVLRAHRPGYPPIGMEPNLMGYAPFQSTLGVDRERKTQG